MRDIPSIIEKTYIQNSDQNITYFVLQWSIIEYYVIVYKLQYE